MRSLMRLGLRVGLIVLAVEVYLARGAWIICHEETPKLYPVEDTSACASFAHCFVEVRCEAGPCVGTVNVMMQPPGMGPHIAFQVLNPSATGDVWVLPSFPKRTKVWAEASGWAAGNPKVTFSGTPDTPEDR